MAQDFDLLGDPIPEGFGKRGRPPHMPTDEKRRLIMMLMRVGKTDQQIADTFRISLPTLRKHYFRELRERAKARDIADGKILSALLDQVDAGNVAAIKEMSRMFEKHDLAALAEAIKNRGQPDRPHNEPKKGKKEQIQAAAENVTGIFAPPPPPEKLN